MGGRQESFFDVHEVIRMPFWAAVLSEYAGMVFFVLLGTGSTLAFSSDEQADFVRIALTFGLGIAMMVQIFGPISGGHFNPAVSFAFLLTGDIGIFRCTFYIIAQVIGAITGSGILYGLAPNAVHGGLGVNGLGKGVSEGHGFVLEMILTSVLLLVISASVDPKRNCGNIAPLMIGLTVAYAHLFGIPYTGASMNPARSFGPAVVSDNFKDHWIYWIGPLVGGPLGALGYKLFNKMAESTELAKKTPPEESNGKPSSGQASNDVELQQP